MGRTGTGHRHRAAGTAAAALALAATLIALVALVGCSAPEDHGASPGATAADRSPGTVPASDGPLRVVTSTGLVGTLVRSVDGEEVAIDALVPVGEDPTAYAVDDADGSVAGADLVVVVDPATFERGLAPVLDAATRAGIPTLVLAPQLGPIPVGASQLGAPAPGADPTATDPHVWLDPDRWTQAGRLVQAALAPLPGADPDHLAQGVASLDDAMAAADERVQAEVAARPAGGTVVTDLPALTYLADRYRFDLAVAAGPGGLAAAATTEGATVVVVRSGTLDAGALPGITVHGIDVDAALVPVPPDPAAARRLSQAPMIEAVQAMVAAAA